MTVCIAAVSDNSETGKHLLLAADNMITIPIGNTIQYQKEDKDHKKIHKLNTTSFALVAGGLSSTFSILKGAKISTNMKPATVAEEVKKSFLKYHRDQIEDAILKPSGIDWSIWSTKQNTLDQQFAKNILEKMTQYNQAVNDSIIIAGFDKDDGLYLGTVMAYTLWDRLPEGLATAGNGGDMAKYSMILGGFKSNLKVEQVEGLVRKAAEDAKHAAGVGDLGDLFVFPEMKA